VQKSLEPGLQLLSLAQYLNNVLVCKVVEKVAVMEMKEKQMCGYAIRKRGETDNDSGQRFVA
jgi:hypothetical protein